MSDTIRTECNQCHQTGILIVPGSPCLRRFADGTKVCNGTMEEDIQPQRDAQLLDDFLSQEVEDRVLSPARRQAINRLNRKIKGICRQCSNKLAAKSIVFCEEHLEQHRERAKQNYVSKNS